MTALSPPGGYLGSSEGSQLDTDSDDAVKPSNHEDLSDTSDPNQEILALARRVTTTNSQYTTLNPFSRPLPTPLDPNSPDFQPRAWAKAFYHTLKDPEHGSPARTVGVAFQNLNVFGYGDDTDFQSSVGNVLFGAASTAKKLLRSNKQRRVDILQDFSGVLRQGEMLAVLGPPGSGCSTLLRTIAGETHGLNISPESYINYQGIHPSEMHKSFRGEAIYAAEVDTHIPTLTVGDTLYFAARARTPSTLPPGVSASQYAEQLRDVVMATYGISHTINTRVGDDFIRGVSGGERKRVTVAEATLSYAPLQCWDNSTRGLDSASAITFCKTLRTQSDIMGLTSCVAIYQAPQNAYDLFDKVTVLYEGRQIYFGRGSHARGYFESLGFACLDRQTTADFLTSMTSAQERKARPGYENMVPRTPEEFVQRWKQSKQYHQLQLEMETYKSEYAFNGGHREDFMASRVSDQASGQRSKSPYTISYLQQVQLCLWRAIRMLTNDPSVSLAALIMYSAEALIIGSIFYNLPQDTSTFFKRGVLLFYTVLLNAFSSMLEILTLYAQRKVIEKHDRYALYHPSANAFASMIADLPYKLANCLIMNTTIYFMSNLRREPGPYFFFMLFSFAMTIAMSMLFRFIGSVTKTIEQALAPASVVVLAMMTYVGFGIPKSYMLGWASWIRHINPIAYGFESLVLNEFVGRDFDCTYLVPSGPGYENVSSRQQVCAAKGASAGSRIVSGTAYTLTSFDYKNEHRWPNLGYIIVISLVLMAGYLAAVEFISSEKSKGEVLVFKRNMMPSKRKLAGSDDVETGNDNLPIREKGEETQQGVGAHRFQKQTAIFHWQDVCYDIKIKKNETRRLLDHVDGWVKPGTLTALMGVSGAGKTTLLDVLASRITVGVITGDMLVNGETRDNSFQRKTGYVQQQDLHLATSTVREALVFSALLRQSASIPRNEKIAYVDTVIDMLNMHSYADAIVGIPGEGLNVEQRKRLTIGVELAARPQLLLFLDEPTSGLDSQTSWSICSLMEKLTRSGQAILCTIHQPSSVLFQRFDRLLLLAKGGKTVYFGEIGPNSETLIQYFTRNGSMPCPEGANPAEYMLQVTGDVDSGIDWPLVWRESPEYQAVQTELNRLKSERSTTQVENLIKHTEFAASFPSQCYEVTKRVFQQYWRTPSYIYSKALLSIGSALFTGLSFLNAVNTQQGMQNQMFGVFLFLSVALQVVMQIIPMFVLQRTLYEARERPSKAYSWKAFILASIAIELIWNSLMAVFCFLVWYYPVGLYRNARATNAVHTRGFLVFLFIWLLMLMTSSLAHLLIAGLESADAASGLATVLFEMLLLFAGVLAGPNDLPRFWIFMYRVNPLTYVIEGLLATSLANTSITCAENELLTFEAPSGVSCERYMQPYIQSYGGYLSGPEAAGGACRFCPVSDSNAYLATINVDWAHRWRNFGVLWVFVGVNIVGAVAIYWLARVPKERKLKKA